MLVLRSEEESDRVLTAGRKLGERLALLRRLDATESTLSLEQAIGDLNEDARAVAGVGLGAGRSAML